MVLIPKLGISTINVRPKSLFALLYRQLRFLRLIESIC